MRAPNSKRVSGAAADVSSPASSEMFGKRSAGSDAKHLAELPDEVARRALPDGTAEAEALLEAEAR